MKIMRFAECLICHSAKMPCHQSIPSNGVLPLVLTLSLSLHLSSLSPGATFLLRLPCSLQISAAVGAWWRGWPRRHGTCRVRWAPSALEGEARATPRRATEAMRVHGGRRRREARAASCSGGEARTMPRRAAAVRGARGGVIPSFTRQ